MKFLYVIYLFVFFIISTLSQAMYSDILPKKQEALMRTHAAEILKALSGKKVITFSWLSNFIIKYDALENLQDRIKGIQKLETVIQEKQLTLLTTPKKELFKVNETNILICEKIRGKNGFGAKKITLEQAKQLVILIKESGYIDVHANNLMHIPPNKIAIIDTEKSAFSDNITVGIRRLWKQNSLTPNALKFVKNEDIIKA